MELGGLDLLPRWSLVMHPRGSATTAAGANVYGYVSIDVLTADIIPDQISLMTLSEGMNEHGLTVSCQTHRGAEYQGESVSSSSPPPTKLPFLQLAAHVLGSYKSTTEAVTALQTSLYIHGKRVPSGERLHWALADAAGSHVVVEYVLGSLVVRDNKHVGVLTNDPPYDWHVANLNNYAGMSAAWPEPAQNAMAETDVPGLITNTVPSNIGHGGNLVALPGSFTPASRFLNMFFLKQHALSSLGLPQGVGDGITMVTGLLNKVFITRGTVPSEAARSESKYDNSLELTHWATIKIPQERTFMWRSYENMQWRRMDIGMVDWEAGGEFEPIQINDGCDGIMDVGF